MHAHIHREPKQRSVLKIPVLVLTTVTNYFHLILSLLHETLLQTLCVTFNLLEKKYQVIRIYWFKSNITCWRNVRFDFPYVFTGQVKSSNPSQNVSGYLKQWVMEVFCSTSTERSRKSSSLLLTWSKKQKGEGLGTQRTWPLKLWAFTGDLTCASTKGHMWFRLLSKPVTSEHPNQSQIPNSTSSLS